MTQQPDPSGSSNDRDNGRMMKGVGLLGVITSELLVSSGLGVGLGYFLWKKAGMPWWVLLLCSSAGLVVSFYRLYLISKKEM